MKLLVCLLLIACTFQDCFARERIYVENGILLMKELLISSAEDEQKLDHVHEQEVWMESIKTPVLTTSMLSRLKNATKLYVEKGLLITIEIPVHLENIDLNSCSTSHILIDSKKSDFKLKVLYVHHNRLREIPKHLNTLKNLVELVLNDNEITTVDMSLFYGLDSLQVIALQRNNITSITSWQQRLIPLPSLVNLFLDQNQLTEASLSSLHAKSLTTVNLHENNLAKVLGLTSAFPAVTTIRIHGNPLDCNWAKYALEELQYRNVTIADLGEVTCLNGTVVERIVPEEKPTLGSLRVPGTRRGCGRAFGG